MTRLFRYIAAALVLLAPGNTPAEAGVPGGLSPEILHALLDVVGTEPPFSGHAVITVSNGLKTDSFNVALAASGRSVRCEINTFLPAANLPPAEAANLTRIRSVMIGRPDKNRLFVVYPGFRSYVEMAWSQATGTNSSPAPAINLTPEGADNVGDSPCDKSDWSVAENGGDHFAMTVWNDPAQNRFPVQIKIDAPAATIQFQDFAFGAPAEELFEPPAGFMRYAGMQELILKQTEKAAPTNYP